MNFAALWARHSGQATPSLRRTPKAPNKETRQEATYLQREAVQTTRASSVAVASDLTYKPYRVHVPVPKFITRCSNHLLQ